MSAPTTTWTKAEAKAADAELSRLVDAAYAAADAVERALIRVFCFSGADSFSIRNSRGQRTGKSYQSYDGGTTRISIAQVREVLAGDRPAPARLDAAELAEAVAAYDAAVAASQAASQAVDDHDRANYKGWQRFFLVSGGHIHASTGCHTLYPTTRIGWLPELSGETEAEAVAAHGALLCTVCFPSAPVEWTDGRSADDDQYCAGGGTWNYPRETARRGYCSGNYGVCSHCGEKITISSTGKMRKHKKPA